MLEIPKMFCQPNPLNIYLKFLWDLSEYFIFSLFSDVG